MLTSNSVVAARQFISTRLELSLPFGQSASWNLSCRLTPISTHPNLQNFPCTIPCTTTSGLRLAQEASKEHVTFVGLQERKISRTPRVSCCNFYACAISLVLIAFHGAQTFYHLWLQDPGAPRFSSSPSRYHSSSRYFLSLPPSLSIALFLSGTTRTQRRFPVTLSFMQNVCFTRNSELQENVVVSVSCCLAE